MVLNKEFFLPQGHLQMYEGSLSGWYNARQPQWHLADGGHRCKLASCLTQNASRVHAKVF